MAPTGMPDAPRFLLCYEATRADGQVWAIRTNRRWTLVHEVFVDVPVKTVFKGAHAKQPRAYLEGRGVLRWRYSAQKGTWQACLVADA